MKKEMIKNTSGIAIELEYDPQKYEFEYVKDANTLCLKRLKNHKILALFNDRIGFIAQCDIAGISNFLVTDYSQNSQNNERITKFKHYVDNGGSKLKLKNEFNCNSIRLDNCRLTDSSYIVEQQDSSACIYNLYRKTRRYDRIYDEPEIRNMLPYKTVLVTETRDVFWSDIKDTITYGINPEICEITTPIYSELQDRFIPLYNREKINQLKKRMDSRFKIGDNATLGDVTICFEVDKYLMRVAHYFDKPETPYLDNGKVNENYVKKFIKK